MRVFMAVSLTLLLASAQASTLHRVADTGKFRIGFVPDAPPLSFVDSDGTAIGYSIDLCNHIASAVQNHLGLAEMDIVYTPLVSMPDRLDAVESGLVDIECGATTVTLSRRERVDFTLMTFITGSSVLSKTTAPISNVDGLEGKTVAVLSGTTTEAVMRDLAEVNEIKFNLRLIASHDEGMRLLNSDRVSGYASDRAMLIGQVFRNENAENDYVMTNYTLSFEPYAMMLPRGDTEFRLIADRALASIYRSAKIRRIYHMWFGRYGEELPPVVEAMYQFQAVGD